MRLQVAFLSMLPLLLAACDRKVCTAELRFAVRVVVVSNGLPVDSVTARRRSEVPCDSFGEPDVYRCVEQGGGTYVVQVTSGSLTWTKEAVVYEDEEGCHVERGAQLTFELDPDTAD